MDYFKDMNEKGNDLDELILEIVRDMQPITTYDICLELEETLDGEIVDMSEIEDRLNKIKYLEKFDRISVVNRKETY